MTSFDEAICLICTQKQISYLKIKKNGKVVNFIFESFSLLCAEWWVEEPLKRKNISRDTRLIDIIWVYIFYNKHTSIHSKISEIKRLITRESLASIWDEINFEHDLYREGFYLKTKPDMRSIKKSNRDSWRIFFKNFMKIFCFAKLRIRLKTVNLFFRWDLTN